MKSNITRKPSVDWTLNIAIRHTQKGITVDQSAYIDVLVDKFNLTSAYAAKSPMEANQRPRSEDRPASGSPEQLEMRTKPYRALVMSLSHLAQVTRPDISYAVGQLARHQENPGIKHWEAAKRVLRYLKGTRSQTLLYRYGSARITWRSGLFDPKDPNDHVVAFSDADFAGRDDYKSTTGFSLHLSLGSAPILWAARKQGLVSRSTTEAETVAAYDCHQEADVLMRTLQQLCSVAGFPPPPPTLFLKEDNQAVITHITGSKICHKSRYIGVKSAWLRQQYKLGRLALDYCPSSHQCADIFTKPLAGETHAQLLALLTGHASSDAYQHILSTAARLHAAVPHREGVC
jgi:hypothetical protein